MAGACHSQVCACHLHINPYLRNLGPNAILQDDNARPHRARIITEYLQNLNPIEHLWDQLGRAVYARVTHRTTLADLKQMLVEEIGAQATCLAVLLIPRMPDHYMLYLIVKGTNQ